MSLGMEVGLGQAALCYMETQFPLPNKGHNSPQFPAHVCCGQRAGSIKMLLCREVDLGPGDIVLDGDPAPPKRSIATNFRPMSVMVKLLDGSRCHLVGR